MKIGRNLIDADPLDIRPALIDADALDIRPAPVERDWMDTTHQRFRWVHKFST